MKNNKVLQLDSIRGIACLVVVLSHLSLVFFPQLHAFSSDNKVPKSDILSLIHESPLGFLYSGTAAVYCFFVLSGYVLSRSFLNKDINVLLLIASIIKRYPRLAIPSTVSCVLAFLCFLIPVNKEYISSWGFGLGNIHLSLIDALYSGAIEPYIEGKSTYNAVLWSMKIELLGSVLVYLYCFSMKKTTAMKASIYIIILLLIIFISKNGQEYLGYASFFLGVFIYTYKIKINKTIAIMLFLFGLYCSGVHYNSLSYQFIIDYVPLINQKNIYELLNFLGGFLIVLSIISGDIFNRFLTKKPITILGKLSFSIYLTHLPIFYVIGFPLFYFLYGYFSYFTSSIISCFLILFIVIVFSYFFEKYIDNMSVTASNKISKAITNIKVSKLII